MNATRKCLPTNCHSLRGSVDWNISSGCPKAVILSSLPSRECGLKFPLPNSRSKTIPVTPFAGVWIEMSGCSKGVTTPSSLPSRECGLKFWIRAIRLSRICHSLRGSVDWNVWSGAFNKYTVPSLPSRECGLKCSMDSLETPMITVTPFAGVWIEIRASNEYTAFVSVTPFAGVWIEIYKY